MKGRFQVFMILVIAISQLAMNFFRYAKEDDSTYAVICFALMFLTFNLYLSFIGETRNGRRSS